MRELRVHLMLCFVGILIVVPQTVQCRKKHRNIVRFETNMGVIRISLSDETPLHRDNFLHLVASGFYNGTIFHRVIKEFMIQGGDPNSKSSSSGVLLGSGNNGYTIPAEIKYPALYHKRGAVAAAREDDSVNPDFRSSGCQFYIVWGRKFGNLGIKNILAQQKEKGLETNSFVTYDYEMKGGAPHLDGSYTVFGEVIEGLEVVCHIQQQPTDLNDRPLSDIVIIKTVVER